MISYSGPPIEVSSTGAIEESQIDAGSYVFRDEAILGTRMQIQLVARNFSDAQAAACAARTEVDRCNAILNSRDPQSELSALNRSQVHSASRELFAVVAAAERWRVESGGAFSGRLGRLLDIWQSASDAIPSRSQLAQLARDVNEAHVELDPETRTIRRPDAVEFSLDAIAKGWIVDRAFEVARASPGVCGALVNIGGDIRCGGRSPDANGWCVGIPDAMADADNAPVSAAVYLSDHAIATSGRGPRDRFIGGVRFSPTLSAVDGWPANNAVTVSAIGRTAEDADAIATILMTLPTSKAVDWADRRGVSARFATQDKVLVTPRVQPVAARSAAPRASKDVLHFAAADKPPKSKSKASATRWPKDWGMLVTFTAPPKQLVRDQHFRAPYMAMWISDLDNKPIRTLLLVGTHLDWQEDNYIWWSINGDKVKHLAATRSMSTSGSGIYKMLWDGTDDQYQEVPAGKYILHVETSRERGKHTHRSLTLDFSKAQAFTDQIPTSEEAGGVTVNFYHP